jgi:hypothetical protein
LGVSDPATEAPVVDTSPDLKGAPRTTAG